jgi:hypothetical protein
MDIRAGYQSQRDALRVEHRLKFRGRLPDAGGRVGYGGTGDDLDALFRRRFRHLHRHGQVAGAVVQRWQNVTMEISTEY